jgi:hypothetical protein
MRRYRIPGTQLPYYMALIKSLIMRFSPILSDTICFNVENPCSPSNKESKNVIIYSPKWIYIEAYNCISNLIIWFFNTCTIGQTTQLFGLFDKILTLWMTYNFNGRQTFFHLIYLIWSSPNFFSSHLFNLAFTQLFFHLILFNLVFTQLFFISFI